MIAKDLFALNDNYIADNEFKLLTGKQVTLYAFNNSVSYEVFKPITGYPAGGPSGYEVQAEETTAPGTITFPGANGIRLRNASVGLSPAPLASIRVYDRADVIGQGFTPINTFITGAGSVTIAQEVAYNEFTAAVTLVGTTEATATTLVTAASFTADGTSAYVIDFYAPNAAPGAGTINLYLYMDGSSIGYMTNVLATVIPIRISRRVVPVSGSRAFSIRGSSSAGAGVINAGVGGVTNYVPGFIRITKAT